MSDRNSEPSAIQHVGPNETPDWLAAYTAEDTSHDDFAEHLILPRLQVVQGLSAEESKELVGEGGCVILPGNTAVCERGGGFQFVPLYFWSDFKTWSDRQDANSPGLLGQSLSRTSEIARKAKDPDLREEDYGGGFVMSHQEHLNFAGIIYGDHPLAMSPCVISYTKGEHRKGEALVSSISLRRMDGKRIPYYLQVWEMRTALRERGGNKWWGLDAYSPAEGPLVVAEADARGCHEEYTRLKAQHDRDKLQTNYSDEVNKPEPEPEPEPEDAEM